MPAFFICFFSLSGQIFVVMRAPRLYPLNMKQYFPHIAALAFVGAFFLCLPLFPWEALARLAALSLCALAAICALGARTQATTHIPITLQNSFLPACLIGFTLWGFASIFWSGAPGITIISLSALACLPLGFLTWIALPHDDRPAFRRTAGTCLFMILGGLALWVPVQLAVFPDLLIYDQVRWPFANPNTYGALLMMATLAVLPYINKEAPISLRLVFMAFAAMNGCALWILSGRAVLLAFLGGFCLLLLLARQRNIFWRRPVLALIIGAGLGAAVMGLSNANTGPVERFANIAASPTEAVFSRTAIWQGTIDMIKDAPILGRGYGVFPLAYPQYRLPADQGSGGMRAHNDVLQILAELGLPGVLLILLLFLGFCKIGWRLFKEKDDKDTASPGLYAAIAAIAAHSLVSFNFYVPPILVLTGMALGMVYVSVQKKEKKPDHMIRLPSQPVFIAFTLIIMISLYPVQKILRAQSLSSEAMRHMTSNMPLAAYAGYINEAGRLADGLLAAPYIMAADVPLVLLQGKHDENLVMQARNLLASARRANRYDPRTPFLQARLALLEGRTKDAEDSLQQSLQQDPRFLDSRMELFRLLQESGQHDRAYDVLKEGLHWPYPDKHAGHYYQNLYKEALKRGDETVLESLAVRCGQGAPAQNRCR